MDELLKALYDNCYREVPTPQLKVEIEHCHQELIKRPDKPERRLALRIIDCKDHIAEDLSIDSFIAGFRLGQKLNQELNRYEQERPLCSENVRW